MRILDTTATQPLNFNRHTSDRPLETFFDTSKLLDVTTVWALWGYVSRLLLEVFASATVPGLFQSVVLQNNLTNFIIACDGGLSAEQSLILDSHIDGSSNTPATDYWTLSLKYTKVGESNETVIPLVFLPTGDIDTTRTLPSDLVTATTLVSPIIARLGTAIDPWKFINWFVISYYWQFLLDFGQTSPTTYPTDPKDILVLEIPNFAAPVKYPSRNNIFLNSTLRRIYSTFMNDTILPFLNKSHVAPFQPLEGQDLSAMPGQRTFVRSYGCTVRKLRQGFSAFIAVLVADYVLLSAGFKFFCIVAGMLQKRTSDDGTSAIEGND
jgi:hypothetical protein